MLLRYTLTSCLSAKRCARSPPCHHLQGILGGSAEGSLAPVIPKKGAQPGQTGSSQRGRDMTEQVPAIGGGSEHTVCLYLAHQHTPNRSLVPSSQHRGSRPRAPGLQRPLAPLYQLSLSSLPRAAGSQSIASRSEACFCSRHLPH